MRALLIFAFTFFAGGCAAQSSYLPLPASLTSLDPSDAAQLFVVEIRPAFSEPTGYRFEFYAEPREAFRTAFGRHGKIVRERIPEEEAERIRSVWTSFDWRQIEDPLEEGVIVMVPDDLGIEIRARCEYSRHEAKIGISRSSSVRKLLIDLGILEEN